MRVRVRYFAQAREAAGLDEEEMDIPEGASAQALWEAAVARHAALKAIENGVSLVVGRVRAGPAEPLRPGQIVSVVPPVSGG